MNREAWLNELVNRLRPMFSAAGHPLPDRVRVSVGFPSRGGLSVTKPAIGQCWYSESSADQTFEIFISPTIADGLRAADILVHELCHAVLPYGTKHGATFKKLAHKMGLEGKATATVASERLVDELSDLILQDPDLGVYPHAELKPMEVPKTQSTRMRKISCPSCGYTVRASKKWIDVGVPTCPCAMVMAVEEDGE